jgi:lysozyme
MHYGVDVSSNNPHPINWSILYTYLFNLGGAQPFVIVKATQGDGYTNPFCLQDIAAAKAAGFATGSYLMDQGNVPPASEEEYFDALVPGVAQFDDDELPEGLTTDQYLAHLQQLAAIHPAIQYLNQAEVRAGFDQSIGLWLAQYNGQPGVTLVPCLIHQYNDAGAVPGLQGIWDLNVWLGTEGQFNTTFNLVVPPPVPTPEVFEVPQTPIVSTKTTGQLDVFHVPAGTGLLLHSWTPNTQTPWQTEVIAGPTGKTVSGINATFPDQEPQYSFLQGNNYVSASDSGGHVWLFAQTNQPGGGWGVNKAY